MAEQAPMDIDDDAAAGEQPRKMCRCSTVVVELEHHSFMAHRKQASE